MASSGTNNYKICLQESNCARGVSTSTLVLAKTSATADSSSAVTDTASDTTIDVSATDACDPNHGLGPTLVFIGHIVRIAKILIPLVIIGFGILDLFKAITAGKDDEIKKSARTILWRAIAGVVIFFLPALISFAFSWVEEWSNYQGSYEKCFKCVWDVKECTK